MRSSHSLAFCLLLASAAQAQDLNVITGVEVKDEGSSVVVTVKGSKPPNFTTFSMADPARFVIDLSESKFQGVPEDLRVDDGVVRVVKNLAYGSGATAIARVMIAFSADVEPPDVQTDGNTLLVRVVKPAAPAVATTGARPAEAPAAASPAASTPAPSAAGTGAASAAVAVAAAATAKGEADESARQEALAREQREIEAREQASRAAAATAREREAQAAAEAEARAREAEQVAARQAAEEEAARAAAEVRRAEIVAMAARQAEAAKEAEAAKQAEAARAAEASQPRNPKEEAPAAVAAVPVTPAAAPVAALVVTPPAGPTGAELAAAAEAERQARLQDRADAKAKREIEAALAAQQGTAPRTVATPAKPAKLQAVGFKQLPTVSRVFVKTSSAPRFTITDVGDDVVRLEVENTRSSRRNDTRPLDTSFFPSAVALITPSKQGTSYVVDIKLRKRVPYQQKVEGDLLAIDFERPAADGGSAGGPAAVQTAGDAARENDQGLVVPPEDKPEAEDQPEGAEPATGPAPKQ